MGRAPADFKTAREADTSVEQEPRRCFFSFAAAPALRRFMACAAEKADKTRTAAFYLAPAQASRPHGQFTDSVENPPCFCGVSRAQGIENPMTARLFHGGHIAGAGAPSKASCLADPCRRVPSSVPPCGRS